MAAAGLTEVGRCAPWRLAAGIMAAVIGKRDPERPAGEPFMARALLFWRPQPDEYDKICAMSRHRKERGNYERTYTCG